MPGPKPLRKFNFATLTTVNQKIQSLGPVQLAPASVTLGKHQLVSGELAEATLLELIPTATRAWGVAAELWSIRAQL